MFEGEKINYCHCQVAKKGLLVFNLNLLDEEVDILGLDPVGKYLPSLRFKSRNNMVNGRRVMVYDTPLHRYAALQE